MAALVCEICGGKLQGKPGGIFECDSCGIEYSTEWAKAKIQEIKGTVKVEGTVEVKGTVKVEGAANADSLLRRGQMALEDKNWDEAKRCFEQTLGINPEIGAAYWGLALAMCKGNIYHLVRIADDQSAYISSDRITNSELNHTISTHLQRARQFADSDLKIELDRLDKKVLELQQQKKEEQALKEKERLEAEKIAQKKAVQLEERRRLNAKVQGLLCASGCMTLGLRVDGTVLYTGKTNKSISELENIKALTGGHAFVAGITADNSASVIIGASNHYKITVSEWPDIVYADGGGLMSHVVGLRSNGSVVLVTSSIGRSALENEVPQWQDIVAIASGLLHVVGLKADGTVVAAGRNNLVEMNLEKDLNYGTRFGKNRGPHDVAGWKNIVSIAAGWGHTVGLTKEGKVLAKGETGSGQCKENFGWKDVAAIAAGDHHTVALLYDGTVVASGHNDHGQCNVSSWKDIIAISAGSHHTVGISADGTVVAVGNNEHGQCDISGWKLFNDLDTLEQEQEESRRHRAEEAARRRTEKIASLKSEKASIEAELPTIKGLFSGEKRKKLEERLAEINSELKKLGE